ncbi:MAG: hypothetical protein MUF48_03475 [Pirellulaceae bacterium]|jgi:hypothetical protein|nr:hypothetical protein [Pirellulaceae bacterium]
MQSFIVVETEDGLTVAEVDAHTSPETEAERFGGLLADPTPYATFEDAYDALLLIEAESRQDPREPADG